ncbi:type II and III secretion system protein family protein [Sphingomonas mollis]|uniref:Type II and III secretion system protein family protein n=1 Tax=Sphingomonas mollis TaxID=2795726 RepID=A0ABS0XL15_9SPHN|nr:type II and III secretion system protein family protein [Sphingomonas sp. BT553]MBJ6120722.1 type II and III secretion system protein family protein [Sphingomonas sp. BT553]
MRVSMKVLGKPLGGTLCLALAMPTMPVTAQTMPVVATAAPSAAPVVQVNTGRGRLVTLARPMSDLFIADDSIADVQVRSPTQLYIFGKKTGETTISATARGGAVVFTTTVRVGNNLDSVGAMLALAMPDAKVVTTPMNGMMLLTGTVATPGDAAEAERLVQAFVGDGMKVLSHLRTATPLQVNLQVRFAEVTRGFVKNVGVNLTGQSRGGSNFLFGIAQGRQGTISTVPGVVGQLNAPVDTNGARPGDKLFKFPAPSGIGTTLNAAGSLLGLDLLSAIDLGETIGQVTTLANPNLTALSGETGSFLAGGEIPIPIAQGLGAVSVEFKQYGISLAYTPTVLSDGRISLRVRPEVSQLDYSNAVALNGTRVPGISSRRAETTVELGSGQSLMIAGLLSNSRNNSIDKAPFLGDIPILGSLFRSNSWQRNETELVIIITPYLVKPMDSPAEVALPVDGYKAPTDAERILLGRLSDGQTGGQRPVPMMAPPVQAAPTPGAAMPAASPRKARAGAPAPGFTQ